MQALEGAAYLIRDTQGKEIRIPHGQNTRIDRPAHVGDHIQSWLDHRGRRRSDPQPRWGRAVEPTNKSIVMPDPKPLISVVSHVQAVEGGAYLIRDVQGQEIRIPHDENTRIDRPAHVGTAFNPGSIAMAAPC